jgi:hypothetical protein
MTDEGKCIRHFSIPENVNIGAGDDIVNKIAAQVAKSFDKMIIDAMITYAKESGIAELYLIDGEHVMDALKKQIPKAVVEDGYPRCPCCDVELPLIGFNYCPHCGQKLKGGVDDGKAD